MTSKNYKVTVWEPCSGYYNVAYGSQIIAQSNDRNKALEKATQWLEKHA